MEKNNKFKLIKLSNFFTSSCQNQNLSKVIDHNQTPNILQTPLPNQIQEKYPFHNILIQPKQISSYMSPHSPSLKMCKPKSPQTFDHTVQQNYNITHIGNRLKLTGKHSISGEFVGAGRKCSPTKPASPLFLKQGNSSKKKNEKKKLVNIEKNKTGVTKNGFKPNPFSLSSSNETDDNGDWFSSDDEREDCEKQTMFSLKSISFSSKSVSFSSELDTPQTRAQTQTRKTGSSFKEVAIKPEPKTQTLARNKIRTQRRKLVGRMPLEDWYSNIPRNRARGRAQTERRKAGLRSKKVGIDTFAIVKSSSDPYNDFKRSMVEMIIERQIFKGKELKHLLECFISLNSSHHHKLIVEVFSEICNALFCHCS